MKSFENAFDPSIRAAFLEGPKHRIPTLFGSANSHEKSGSTYPLGSLPGYQPLVELQGLLGSH